MSKWAFLGPGEEKVGPAAVHRGRLVSTGVAHFVALAKYEDNFKADEDKQTMEPKEVGAGFITSKGRFINRQKAVSIANKSNQVKKERLGVKNRPQLTSEDLEGEI